MELFLKGYKVTWTNVRLVIHILTIETRYYF